MIAAVIPVLNEAGAIGPTLRQLPPSLIDHIIVVDGGSTDGTQGEARAAGAEVLHEPRRGYGRACLSGAKRAHALGAGVVLFLDGDGADAAECAASLIDPVVNGDADFVLASRIAKREHGSIGLHQILAGRLIGGAVGLLSGVRYTDMCAFRAIRTDALLALSMQEMTYGWNLEMQIRAASAGLRIQEIPLPYRNRIAGRSKVAGNLRGSVRAATRILVTLARVSYELRRA